MLPRAPAAPKIVWTCIASKKKRIGPLTGALVATGGLEERDPGEEEEEEEPHTAALPRRGLARRGRGRQSISALLGCERTGPILC